MKNASKVRHVNMQENGPQMSTWKSRLKQYGLLQNPSQKELPSAIHGPLGPHILSNS
jgi:hypothetical protein